MGQDCYQERYRLTVPVARSAAVSLVSLTPAIFGRQQLAVPSRLGRVHPLVRRRGDRLVPRRRPVRLVVLVGSLARWRSAGSWAGRTRPWFLSCWSAKCG
jgi:hypothetical protein